jgi:hypothetical protein
VLHVLAHWGARSLGPPTALDDLEPGWLPGALRIAVPATCGTAAVEFRIDDEVASIIDREVVVGSIAKPDAIVSSDARGFYRLLVERDLEAVAIEGDRASVSELVAALPAAPAAPVR